MGRRYRVLRKWVYEGQLQLNKIVTICTKKKENENASVEMSKFFYPSLGSFFSDKKP